MDGSGDTTRAQSSLWRAHQVPPPPVLCPWCVYYVSVSTCGMGAIRCGVWHKVMGGGGLFSRVAWVPSKAEGCYVPLSGN